MKKPVENGRISSGYGWRTNLFDKTKKEFHPGIDIVPGKGSTNPEIYNVWKGKVHILGTSSSFGERVWIKLMDGPYKGLCMVYSHMKEINPQLKSGMIINEGELIGWMGSTGKSTGEHTHLEIRPLAEKPGESVNPIEISEMYKS